MMKRKAVMLSLLTLIMAAGTPALAKSLTLTTYYPEPRATYDRLRFVPRSPLANGKCNMQTLGTIYYDQNSNVLMSCFDNKTHTGAWAPITGSGGGAWEQDDATKSIYPKNFNNPNLTVAISTDTPDPTRDLHINYGNILLGDGTDTDAYLEMLASGRSTFRWLMDDALGNHLFLQNNASGSFQDLIDLNGDDLTVGIGGPADTVSAASTGVRLSVHGSPNAPAGEPELLISGKEGLFMLDTEVPPALNSIGGSTAFCLNAGSPLGSSIDSPTAYCMLGGDFYARLWFLQQGGSTVHPKFFELAPVNYAGALAGNIIIGTPEVHNTFASRLAVQGDGTSPATSSLDVQDSSGTSMLFVRDDGRVGIGTTSPQSDLHIHSPDGRAIIHTRPDTTLGSSAALALVPPGSSTYAILAMNHGFLFHNATGTIYSDMTQDRDGNLGIRGIIPPFSGDRLNVRYNIQLTGCVRENGTTIFGTCASDIHLKTNIHPLTGSLSRLARLRPVIYEFTDEQYGTGPQSGLIAQDVESVFPEWVTETDNGYKAVSYGLPLQMHMIEAVRELRDKIDRVTTGLREEHTVLTERIKELKEQLGQE